MIDVRTFPQSLDKVRNILIEKGAVLKGDYYIHDSIYASRDPEIDLGTVFLRLRNVTKNIWDEKQFIVAIKNTNILDVGKQSSIPVKKQFDTKEEALSYIEENYSETFVFDYEFGRSGEQWFLGEDGVDLEVIEGYPSIEFKSKTEEGLKKLLSLFGVQDTEVVSGPSVVTIRKMLK